MVLFCTFLLRLVLTGFNSCLAARTLCRASVRRARWRIQYGRPRGACAGAPARTASAPGGFVALSVATRGAALFAPGSSLCWQLPLSFCPHVALVLLLDFGLRAHALDASLSCTWRAAGDRRPCGVWRRGVRGLQRRRSSPFAHLGAAVSARRVAHLFGGLCGVAPSARSLYVVGPSSGWQPCCPLHTAACPWMAWPVGYSNDAFLPRHQ